MLALTGFLLWFAPKGSQPRTRIRDVRFADAIVVGIAQGIAVIPGLSRSGTTITTLLWRGIDSELAMMGLVLAIMILIFAVVWFVFMLPMEKGLHKRRMELLQRKLLQNEERLKREAAAKARVERANQERNEDRPRRRAGGS